MLSTEVTETNPLINYERRRDQKIQTHPVVYHKSRSFRAHATF